MSNLARCVIATRESPLAMWQAVHVQQMIRDKFPSTEVELMGMTTRGDQILDRPLAKIGGKGLFVQELEQAMRDGRADLAVHSLKDIPMDLSEGFVLAGVSDREDPRDAFVSPRYASLDDMPQGAVVGTASLRRELMLRIRYPHLTVRSIRGNVGTRLRKLDEGQYDALVMAYSGLKRLGLESRIRAAISTDVSLPAPGQGVLGYEAFSGNKPVLEMLSALNNPQVLACVKAERAVSRALGGSCQVPLAAYACPQADGETMLLRSIVGNHRTGEYVSAEARGILSAPEEVAETVLDELRRQGVERLLREVLSE